MGEEDIKSSDSEHSSSRNLKTDLDKKLNSHGNVFKKAGFYDLNASKSQADILKTANGVTKGKSFSFSVD